MHSCNIRSILWHFQPRSYDIGTTLPSIEIQLRCILLESKYIGTFVVDTKCGLQCGIPSFPWLFVCMLFVCVICMLYITFLYMTMYYVLFSSLFQILALLSNVLCVGDVSCTSMLKRHIMHREQRSIKMLTL